MGETPTSKSRWFGFERVRVDYQNHAVDITVGSEQAWDRAHLRRLRQSSDLPGLVPVIDADVSSDGLPYVVTAAVDDPSFSEKLASDEGLSWNEATGITEAVARACHEAHERDLFHGALCPDDVYLLEDEIAVEGLGLTQGGDAPTSRTQWIAPEVLAGDPPTARSDVYSLGKILEAALGSSADLVPRSVKRLIMWSSSDTPEARPRSAAEFAEILSDGLGDAKQPFRPAFIPTIRANNLTADAEKAVASSQAETSEAVAPADTDDQELTDQELVDAENVDEETIVTTDDDATEEIDLSSELIGTSQDAEDDDEQDDDEATLVASGEDVDGDADDTETEDEDTDSDEDTDVDETGEGDVVIADEIEDVDIDLTDEDDDVSVGEDTEQLDALSMPDKPAKGSAAKGAAAATAVGAGAAAAALSGSKDKSVKAASSATSSSKKSAAAARAETRKISTAPGDDDRDWTRFLIPALLILSVPLLLWALTRGGNDNEAANGSTEDSTSASIAEDAESSDDSDPTDEDDNSDEADSSDTAQAEELAAPSVDDDDDTEESSSPTTEDDTTETTAEVEETTVPETTEDAGAAESNDQDDATTTTTEAPSTTEAPEDDQGDSDSASSASDDSEAGSPAAPKAEPIAASEAAVQVLHGIPGATVDVYVDGVLTAPAFEPESIAGPVDLTPGAHTVTLFAATDDPAEQAADRSDDAVLEQEVTASSSPATLVAHLDDAGQPALSTFGEKLGALDAGETRLVLRNFAAESGDATLTIDGEEQTTPVANGEELAVTLSPGERVVTLTSEDGDEIFSTSLDLVEGELTTVNFTGTVGDGSASVVLQRYDGLSSAPSEVPTGDSGLAGSGASGNARVVLSLVAMMLFTGVALAFKRRRNLS